MPTVAEVVAVIEQHYPPSLAEDWDAVGLVVGEPDAEVTKVGLAVDPVLEVVTEAKSVGAQFLLTHHPLYLRGTSTVAATTAKGRVVHELIRSGIALQAAHTNADAAVGGANDALAAALGLVDTRPLAPAPRALDLLICYVPEPDAERLLDALSAAGAGAVGDYERCAWTVPGRGTFTPRPGANPTIGDIDEAAHVTETRLEMVLEPRRRAAVVAALRAAHPYEEPAFSLVATVPQAGSAGLGRIGRLPEPTTLRRFGRLVADALPSTEHGVRLGGDLERAVETVALCTGAGDSFLGDARQAGVDVYLCADLRHHPASEALAEPGAPALVDVSHWASEWLWLPGAARMLASELGVETHVSTLVTDPWTAYLS